MKTEAVPPQRTRARAKSRTVAPAAASAELATASATVGSVTTGSPDIATGAQSVAPSWETLTPDAGDPRTNADEWLEADGLGGFASGTRYGIRTRRYHALLLSASVPPSGRLVLINGVEAWVETAQGDVIALTTQAYAPDTLHPDGWRRLRAFSATPWPTWRYTLAATPDADDGGDSVTFEICNAAQGGDVILRWSAQDRTGALAGARLRVRPLLSVRDYHSLHKRNDRFDFTPSGQGGRISWRPYADRIAVSVLSNGTYRHDPEWFDRFRYQEETMRGLDDTEDLASPGIFTFAFGDPGDQAMMVLRAGDSRDIRVRDYVHQALQHAMTTRAARSAHIAAALRHPARSSVAAIAAADTPPPSADTLAVLGRAVHSYIVERGAGATVIAGYPWFTDWGRDTFIALRGIALSSGNIALAGAILQEWASVVDQGMLPNRFTDDANPDAPAEYNAVDASLWFVVAAHAFLGHAPDTGAQDGLERGVSAEDGNAAPGASIGAAEAGSGPAASIGVGTHPLQPILHRAMEAIVEGYAGGTRYGIHADVDGLLFAGVPESQLTWMDARVGIRPVTPRIGKPVEVQALWINALRIVGAWVPKWRDLADQAQASFTRRFIQDGAGQATADHDQDAPANGIFGDVHEHGLHDNVDADGEPGRIDASLRPNQIFAVGGLPYPVVDLPTARAIVAHVERHLWTPMGLRTLAPSDPRYIGRYEGSPDRRDNAYHQGTVWPWLLGPFVEAWLRVHAHGRAPADLDRVAAEARRRFIAPLDAHLASAGIGHISEIADGDAPHTPRGAPFQAWSLAERLRMEVLLRYPESAATVPFI
ncbi:amylo-alpha-1,6-glucosidase [Robbsia sp. KACC 23696]|uniref:amylo-alpha-1,6-glucosidase n=1 Tax=Robbsia sp. KACC 23696 TaxID=3149231 RepID=UPI00325BCB1B